MDWNKLQEYQENAMDKMYQNPSYNFERVNKQTFAIDVTINTGTDFSVTLHEPLKIDKLSDIYLESLLTFKAFKRNKEDVDEKPNYMGFILSINELPIQNNSSNANMFNKVFISNMDADTVDVDDPGGVSIHKSRKFNFICSVNPMTLSNISGSITNILTTPGSAFANTGRFIAEFVVVARE